MRGAIIGDIIGSVFEGKFNIPADFEFFTPKNTFTDDTVHTLAVAKAIVEHRKTGIELQSLAEKYLRKFGRQYIWNGCGDMMYKWLMTENVKEYNQTTYTGAEYKLGYSCGNGAVMRISACAWLADTLEQALEYAEKVTLPTHNNEDAIRAAKAVTEAIFLIRFGCDKTELVDRLILDGLYTPTDISEHTFDITAKGTLNIAMHYFINSNCFKDCIHKTVLHGGDTDTNAAVAGSLAEAYYGVPREWNKAVFLKLTPHLIDVLKEAEREIIPV